jgi:hypothetical protein
LDEQVEERPDPVGLSNEAVVAGRVWKAAGQAALV